MSDRETRDFMSVDSFSQLPFIRPSPKHSSSSNTNSAIRLFGIDFPPDPPSTKEMVAAAAETADTTNSNTAATASASAGSGSGRELTGRKFECHYCCRNFPTSQALGGHQNAHKRERQHAKRAHLQSAMAAHHHHHHQMAPTAEGHVYGILNYHRLGSIPTTQQRFGLEPPTGPPPHYPSWSSSSWGGTRFYGGLGSVSQPIHGSPLSGLWRVPNETHSRSMELPLLRGELEVKPVAIVNGGSTGSSSTSHPQDRRRGCELGAKDHSVSLDLHL